jgi:hypothetical protein
MYVNYIIYFRNDVTFSARGKANFKGLATSFQKIIMEVFHHPDLHHERKPWKEYFIEFLMIFFAVTLGFFAENLRSTISDEGHVRQLASQLIQDLENDSAILDDHILREEMLIRKSDSLFYLLSQPLSSLDTKKLQELIIACYNINLFQPSSGALFAIKNELHLRQFAQSNITSYISGYETNQVLLKTIEEFQMKNLKEYLQDFITAHFTPTNAFSALSSLSNGNITNGELRNITQHDLTQLSVDIVFVKNYDILLAETSRQLMGKASEFLKYTSKEFK